jgi:hypothetical protein
LIRVILESPYSGDVPQNVAYAQKCMRDCLRRGETPYASHLLYTQPNVLDDTIPEHRALGMRAGFEWTKVADKTVVYYDLGVSKGMIEGIRNAEKCNIPIEFRKLY